MSYIFKINNNMKFKIKASSEKEYTEKEPTPCKISFSADALFADLVSAVFNEEDEATYGD